MYFSFFLAGGVFMAALSISNAVNGYPIYHWALGLGSSAFFFLIAYRTRKKDK